MQCDIITGVTHHIHREGITQKVRIFRAIPYNSPAYHISLSSILLNATGSAKV